MEKDLGGMTGAKLHITQQRALGVNKGNRMLHEEELGEQIEGTISTWHWRGCS